MSKNTQPLYTAVEALRQRLLMEPLPHDDSRPSYADVTYSEFHSWTPKTEASARENVLFDTSDVEVGDLVLIVSNEKYRGEWRYSPIDADSSIRDIAHDYRFHVVTGKTAQRIKVRGVLLPRFVDEVALPEVSHPDEAWGETTYAAYSEARRIVRTGLTLDDYVAAVKAHPDYDRYLCLREAARTAYAAWQEEQKAEAKAKAETRKPREQAAKALNKALGLDIARVAYISDSIEFVVTSADLRELVGLALRGRLLAGEITEDESFNALATTFNAVKR